MLKVRISEIILVASALVLSAAIIIFTVVDNSKAVMVVVSYDTTAENAVFVDEAIQDDGANAATAVGNNNAQSQQSGMQNAQAANAGGNNAATKYAYKTAVTTKSAAKATVKKTATEKFNGVLNINTASAEQLMLLDGIGEVIAGRIVQYRNENGAFASIEDIKNVSGIGDKKFEAIKTHIKVR